MTEQQKAEGWIAHDGGECPVALDSKPGVLFGNGYKVAPGIETAGHWLVGYWTHHHNFHPQEYVIAYRPETTQ